MLSAEVVAKDAATRLGEFASCAKEAAPSGTGSERRVRASRSEQSAFLLNRARSEALNRFMFNGFTWRDSSTYLKSSPLPGVQ